MAKRQSITLSVTIDVKVLKGLIKSADMRIVNQEAFKVFINSDKFKKVLGDDIVQVWEEANEEADDDLAWAVDSLFGDQVVFNDD
jgi:hypothetical protein